MLNKAILMGRLTRDPELRYTDAQIPVVNFTLAVERDYKQGEERQADFIPITAWRGTAEFISRNFTKGQLVAVTGKIQVRSYEKSGEKRMAVNVIADEVYFAEPKRGNDSAKESNETGHQTDDGFMPVDSAADLPF